jgi:F-type H+-transporting ATPase subunit b
MICFWLTLWVVYRYLIVPVGRVLAERQGRLDRAEGDWEATHQEYLEATARVEREMETAAREAGTIRSELRQKALEQRQETLDEARRRADGRLEEALSTLDEEAAAARTELVTRADSLARLFASQLLDREVAS